MEIIKLFIFAYLSTFGFAALFSIPRDAIVKSGFVGALGWICFHLISTHFGSIVVGTFVASMVVGILGELFARLFKKPATVYIIPGIVPFVPGAGMYYTMLALVRKDFMEAANKGTETFFIAAAISIGIIVSTTLSRSINRVKNKG